MEDYFKAITAEKARELTKSSHRLFNNVYRMITDSAKSGLSSCEYCAEMDDDVKERLVDDLNKMGYTVSHHTINNAFTVTDTETEVVHTIPHYTTYLSISW